MSTTDAVLTDQQVRALYRRSSFSQPPFHGREQHGVRDAQNALATLLAAHATDREALTRAVHAYLAQGPAWDSQDYYDGGDSVHADVAAVWSGDPAALAEMAEAEAHDQRNKPPAPAGTRPRPQTDNTTNTLPEA